MKLWGNKERAREGGLALRAFAKRAGETGETETNIVDLIADLLHYGRAQGIPPKRLAGYVVHAAADHFDYEVREEA